MVTLAVKVTLLPVHTELPGLADNVIVGTTEAFTVIVTPPVTLCGLAQGALLVTVQVKLSPFTMDAVVYVGRVPTGLPFLYHW